MRASFVRFGHWVMHRLASLPADTVYHKPLMNRLAERPISLRLTCLYCTSTVMVAVAAKRS